MSDPIGWLAEPLSYAFMTRGLLASVIVGIVCSMLGTYVVLRGMAFFGDALAHAILPGVVIAHLLGWPLSVGAVIVGILTAFGIGTLSRQMELKEDTAIGVIFAGTFALGVALLSTIRSYTTDLAHFLFGTPAYDGHHDGFRHVGQHRPGLGEVVPRHEREYD